MQKAVCIRFGPVSASILGFGVPLLPVVSIGQTTPGAQDQAARPSILMDSFITSTAHISTDDRMMRAGLCAPQHVFFGAVCALLLA
jgi:hypothetical protein